MALHLIIDGYNLIRQSPYFQEIDARELEAGREALLSSLAAYRQARPQHKITVVFDGWIGGDVKESRDRRAGMAIVYSRRGERADEVIKRLLEKERSRAVVVSSDRELQDYADRVGAAWISAPEFEMHHLRGAAAHFPDADEERPSAPGTQKKGPSRRAPKHQRQRQQRLKKL
ncbi:MAG: NYN domain-containing protein [Deltaproteobacteria bacterium]|nr:NYN domain-containing protein [Deltaproteobacteria bacterium]